MRFFILLSVLSVLVFATGKAHPRVYASLGDEIYDNIVKIEKLKSIDQFKDFGERIDAYKKKLEKTKKLGYGVESGARSNLSLDYLSELREHKKTNDFFVRSVQSAFKSAVDTQNNKLFLQIVNTDLLDKERYKNKILNYYKAHKSSIDPKEVIQGLLDEELVKQIKNKKYLKKKIEAKKRTHEEKVKRLRENDKLEREALEKKLSEEVRKKKEAIRREQERELFN
jgi:hypothetical protein